MASLRGATDARQMNWSGHRRMSSTLNFTVKSTGGNNDDVPEFYVDGGKLPVSTGGGVNVAVVEQDGELKTFKVFDTHADGSEALVSFLNDLSMGSIVLLAVRDDAQSLQSNMSQAATAAIESCGADKIKNLVYRGAYALIGIKGGQALAEETGKGYVVAVAQREVAISVEVDKPVCAARVPEPPVTGYVSNGNLKLDAGCRYALWEKDNTAQCLQGTWVIITGASNALLEFGNLINHMAPDEYHIEREGEMIGASAVADVIIEDGKVRYWAVVDNELPVCRQVDKAIAAQNDAACREAIREHLAKAPLFAGSGTRITMFISFFWDRTSVALDAVSADPGWAGAEVSLVTQVGAWYNVCSVTKEEYCPRKELLAMDRDSAVQVFKDEMEEAFSKMDVFCSSSGRAGKRGCNVQTISWTNGERDNVNFREMNRYIKEAMETRKSKNFRLIDFFNLGAAMPEEIVQGHGSQMLNLWVWQVMLGTMCPADEAADRSDAQFEGNLCSGTEAKFDNCPEYYPACKDGPRCERWECMNSVPCTLRAVQPPMAGNTEGMCDDPVSITSLLQTSEHESFDECYNARGLRVRLWCQNGIQWLLPLVFTVLAVAVVSAQYAWERKYGSKKAFKQPAEKEDRKEQSDKISGTEGARELVLMSQPTSQFPARLPSNMEPHSPACSAVTLEIKEEGFTDVVASERADPALQTDIEESAIETGELKHEETKTEHNRVALQEEKSKDVEKAAAPAPEAAAAAAAVPEKSAPKIRVAGNKFPLGLARFLGSTHVVMGHLSAKGVTDPVYFFGWGFTWVPWFFMLSGFVLFSAYLKNPKPETMIQYVLRRSVTIYPLYAVSLLPSFAIAKGLGKLKAEPLTLVAQSFLLQAWVPHWTESALQMHCWFLSCMVVYWFFFKPLAYCLKNLSLARTCSLMAFLFFLPWLLVLVPVIANEPVDWYKEHRDFKTDTALDLGVVMLKFNPVCYVHVFILGMLLARLRVLLDPKALAAGPAHSWRNPYRIVLQFVAPLGYLFLMLVFNVEGFEAKLWGYKLSARLSVLLPFQAMVLFGLAGLPSLPLPLFSYAFSQLDFLENYSYAVYVFQFLCYAVWPQTGKVNLPLFLAFTYGFAVVVARLVQQPVQRWWASHPTGRCFVPFVLAATLAGLSFLPKPEPDSSLSDIPAFLKLDEDMMDMRLELNDPDGEKLGADVINPSLLIHGNRVVVVARRHRQETLQYTGTFSGPEGSGRATIIDQVWHSDIILGNIDVDAQAWANWPAGGANPLHGLSMQTWSGLRTPEGRPWTDLCTKDTWIAANNTLIRHVVTGPEDPKAVSQNGSLVIVFDSLPPSGGGEECRRNQRGFSDAVTQMYISSGVKVSEPSAQTPGFRLTYGLVDEDEKNWVPFTTAESLYFAYAPMPHVIVTAQPDGSSSKVFSTSFRPLQRIVQENPSIRIRGSAQAVFVDDPSATPNLPYPHHLALLHLYNTSSKRYAHFAYRFSAQAPFTMLQMSDQLPLTEAEAKPGGIPFAFASGLVLQNRTVAVTYGAGDRDARALVLTLERLDQLFECSLYADA
eukprot:TRINITY_DN2405_c0_g1_i2.p1 TRINITY_DN2405_c0_g1~~TRINITY_DN2405_c0_g1_i2.p1  ORF type:complete len:1595 (+),score=335.47 TRINITY_DN2405_c0_g1_i2:126-4787(+)